MQILSFTLQVYETSTQKPAQYSHGSLIYPLACAAVAGVLIECLVDVSLLSAFGAHVMAPSHRTGWHHLGARFLRFPFYLHFADCKFFITILLLAFVARNVPDQPKEATAVIGISSRHLEYYLTQVLSLLKDGDGRTANEQTASVLQ